MKIVIALTGGSGAPYFTALLERLQPTSAEVEVVSSATGRQVLQHETGKTWKEVTEGLVVHSERNMGASIASGSNRTDAMVVVPCSMSTLAEISLGTSSHLIHRAASVQLKERRPLILVPRESPYSLIHLQAMTRVTEAGGMILPASPGFYHHPKSVDDLVKNIVDRILDQIGCSDKTIERWGS